MWVGRENDSRKKWRAAIGRIRQGLMVENVNKVHEQSLKLWIWATRKIWMLFFERASIRRPAFVCLKFWVRKGGLCVCVCVWFGNIPCLLLSQPHVAVFAWRSPISSIHKKILISELRLLTMFPYSVSMYLLFWSRSFLSLVYNCKHRKVVVFGLLISTKTITLFWD